jgi:hypothetical protein
MATRRKTGGRKKGVPNKSTLTFRAALANTKFDAAEELVQLYQTQIPADLKLKILQLILEYSQPKPKEQPIDVPPSPQDDLPEAEADLIKLVKSE